MMEKLIQTLKSTFNVSDVNYQKPNLTFITAPKDQAVALMTHLRDYEKFSHLVFLTAVDYIERNVFQLTYMLHNYENGHDLGIKVEIDRTQPQMTTIHHLWAQAATYQRELKEMFGIDFPDSPRVDEPFILESWENMPPMRRDFDTKKYAEETYFNRPGRKTHDPEEYMKEKLYPDD
jgi:NADH-quinone oxidoreductase subunit C